MRNKKGQFVKGYKQPSEIIEKRRKRMMGNTYGFKKGSKMNVGEGNPMWKGGVIYRQGYKFIKDRKHRFANGKGYVRNSLIVMEKKLGRSLKKGEIIHHINGNKLDDKPENLYLFKNNAYHTSYERNLKTTYKLWLK